MNEKTLLDALNTLVGKVFYDGVFGESAYNMSEKISGVVKKQLENENISKDVLDRTYVTVDRTAPSYCYLKYDGYVVCTIRVRKVQGNYARRGHYEWLFKSFEVNDFDFNTEIERIKQRIVTVALAKKEEDKKMLACYKQMKTLFGDNTDEVLTFVYRHLWYLKDLERKENA